MQEHRREGTTQTKGIQEASCYLNNICEYIEEGQVCTEGVLFQGEEPPTSALGAKRKLPTLPQNEGLEHLKKGDAIKKAYAGRLMEFAMWLVL